MPGDYWQKFANYRILMGLQFTHPGKKLLFMGGEFAQMHEWKDKEELDWFLLEYPFHKRANRFVRDLIHVYDNHKCFYELDHNPRGFRWIDQTNYDQSIFSFIRQGKEDNEFAVVIMNMTPNAYNDFSFGVPKPGKYEEILNSDKDIYGGSNVYNGEVLTASDVSSHGFYHTLNVKVAPLSITIIKYKG